MTLDAGRRLGRAEHHAGGDRGSAAPAAQGAVRARRGLRARARAQPGRRGRPRVARRDAQPPRARGPLPPLAHDPVRGRGRAHDDRRGRRDDHRRRRPRRPQAWRARAHARARRARPRAHSTWRSSTRSSTRSWCPTSRRWCGRRTGTPRRSTRCCTSPRWCWSTRSTSPTRPSAVARAQQICADAYVVDLAWLRSTPWRERVAATFDPPQWRDELGRISSVKVRHHADSGMAGLLFCGWLASRLGWEPDSLVPAHGTLHGRAHSRRQDVELELLPDERMSVPGLAGIEIGTASGMTHLAGSRPGRPVRAPPRPQGARVDLDGAGRVARRGGNPRARGSARRCCATPPTAGRSSAPRR